MRSRTRVTRMFDPMVIAAAWDMACKAMEVAQH
jgi:hypothetical protein